MITVVICIALAVIIVTGLIIKFGKVPPWSHKDMLAYAALMGTILFMLVLVLFVDTGQQTFTRQADALIKDLVVSKKVHPAVGNALTTIIEAQAFNFRMALGGLIVGMLSLGLVISARSLKASGFGGGIELTTGADGQPAIPVVVQQPKSDPVPTTEAKSITAAAPAALMEELNRG